MSSKPACIFVRNRATQIKRWKDILEALKDFLKAIKAMSSADDMTFSIEEDSLKLSIVGNDAHRHTSIEYALPSLHTESRRFRIPMTEGGRTTQTPTKDLKS